MLHSDVNVKLVSQMRSAIKSKVALHGESAGGANTRKLVQKCAAGECTEQGTQTVPGAVFALLLVDGCVLSLSGCF